MEQKYNLRYFKVSIDLKKKNYISVNLTCYCKISCELQTVPKNNDFPDTLTNKQVINTILKQDKANSFFF